jgi:hypothetical protein
VPGHFVKRHRPVRLQFKQYPAYPIIYGGQVIWRHDWFWHTDRQRDLDVNDYAQPIEFIHTHSRNGDIDGFTL